MPGTLQAADATIKKLEDFMSTMEANGERIRGLLEAGRQLVSEGNVHAEKIQEKADSVERRYHEDGGQVGGPKGVIQLCLTLQYHGLQHARLPCPSPSPGVCSNSCPLSR